MGGCLLKRHTKSEKKKISIVFLNQSWQDLTMGRYRILQKFIFGGTRPRNSSVVRSEFNQLSETISSNIFTIQSSGSNLERALKALGTRRDTQGLRDSIHVIQMSANQVVNQTSQELVQLASIARTTGDRMFHLQV